MLNRCTFDVVLCAIMTTFTWTRIAEIDTRGPGRV